MDAKQIMQIFEDTAYVRMGGSEAELKCANYLVGKCAEMGLAATIESFPVQMATLHDAQLICDGISIPCKGYLNAGSAEIEAPFYYLTNTDPYSLSLCRGKIVMIDGYLGYWIYQDLLENGAVGFITYDGNANYTDEDIDQRELRAMVHKGTKIPGVNINAKSAIRLIENETANAKIVLNQDEYEGESRNVILDLPGEIPETIVFTAHYDSTSLSQGAYDNMSGSIGLLAFAEYFSTHPHRYGLRFIWCGSEERGLLGAKAWVRDYPELAEKCVLNVNLDMIGSIMGKFHACVTGEEKLVSYIEYFAAEQGFGIGVKQGVYSSDSSPMADAGIPAVSFARLAANNTGTIHNRYDTLKLMKAEHMVKDIAFIQSFTERMANAVQIPVKREIPDNMKERLDEYLGRKRPKEA